MKSYGFAALAPLATTHPGPPTDVTGTTRGRGRGTKAIAAAELNPRNPPEWNEGLFQFFLLTLT